MEKIMQIKELVVNFINEHKKISLRILAGLIVLITIVVIASALKEDKIGNTAGNLMANHGISAEAGKWTYYIEFDDGEPSGIYRVKTNGSKTEKIKGGYFEYINVIDKYIYCLEKDEDKKQYNLVKMKTNGNKKETIAKNIDYAPITAAGDRVYYFKEGILYRIKTNGSDKQKLSEKDISYYEISGNMIYYIYENEGDSYIAKMKLNGEKNTRIGKLEDSSYVALHVKGNKIYYVILDEENKYKLFKMKTNGEKEERLYTFSNSIDCINMQDDTIYYVFRDGKYNISKINYKAGDKETIKKIDEVEAIGISGKWVFYVEESENDLIIERVTTNGKKEQSL